MDNVNTGRNDTEQNATSAACEIDGMPEHNEKNQHTLGAGQS